ncbi:MAG: MarR family transcriptional regulator [Gemmatimonadales bacterium]
MTQRRSAAGPRGVGRYPRDEEIVRYLARFRYRLRKFLRFSEQAARQCGVTPLQHQLLLSIAGHTGRTVTISQLAEFLQERHNSVVALVTRAVARGLVRKVRDTRDRRYVFVSLTPKGKTVLTRLARLHEQEVLRFRTGL